MNLIFYSFPKAGGFASLFEQPFIDDLSEGVRNHGDQLEVAPASEWGRGRELADVAIFVGLRGITRVIVDAYRAAGKRVVILDKGAIRQRNLSYHRRVYLDGGTCLSYLMRTKRPSDRWEQLGIDLHPMSEPSRTGHIIYANNSQKVHDYWGLGDARTLAETTIRDLQRLAPTREIVFRPKPRALDFSEIDGTTLSLKPYAIEDALAGANCLVTHTSHCTVNALIAGVPVVALGPNPARPLAGKYVEQALQPPVPSEDQRLRWLCNLAYTQWTPEEFRSGEAWEFTRNELAAMKGKENEDLRHDPGEVGVEGSSE